MKYYHYTSVQALYNIVKNQEIWLSSPKSSNDLDEFANAFYTYKEYILQQNLSFPELKTIDWKVDISKKIFYLSCTTEIDDASHYKNYGNNSGISIEFDSRAIDKYINSLSIGRSENLNKFINVFFDRNKFLEFSKVIYKKNNKFKYINSFFEASIDYSKYFSDNVIEKNIFMKQLVEDGIYHFRAIMKSSNHSLDKETRLIFYPDIFKKQYTLFETLNNNLHFLDERMKPLKSAYNELLIFIQRVKDDLGLDAPSFFEYTNGEIREFRKIRIKHLLKYGLIKKIIIGPKCLQNIDELSEFLSAHNIICSVEYSKVKLK